METTSADETKVAERTLPEDERHAMVDDAPAMTAMATGTVEFVKGGDGEITIAHGPVEALKWPAMTMTFKATPDQVASVKAGQKVAFEFEPKGVDNTIIRITPLD